MNKVFAVLCLFVLYNVSIVAQINYQFTEGLSTQRMYEEASPTLPLPDHYDTQDSLKLVHKKAEAIALMQLVEAIRQTDLSAVSPYFSVELKKDASTIDSLLEDYERQFDGLDSIVLFENPTYSVSFHGKGGKTQFTREPSTKLLIEFQYYFLETLRISQITINDVVFPASIEQVYALEATKWENDLPVLEKYKNYKQLVTYIDPKNEDEVNDFYLPIDHKYLADLYGDLAWYALLLGKNEEAIAFAKTGLEHDPDYYYIYSYLALGLAQTGQLEESETIYQTYKEHTYRNASLVYKFQKDIKQLEKVGITVNHKEKLYHVLKDTDN